MHGDPSQLNIQFFVDAYQYSLLGEHSQNSVYSLSLSSAAESPITGVPDDAYVNLQEQC